MLGPKLSMVSSLCNDPQRSLSPAIHACISSPLERGLDLLISFLFIEPSREMAIDFQVLVTNKIAWIFVGSFFGSLVCSV